MNYPFPQDSFPSSWFGTIETAVHEGQAESFPVREVHVVRPHTAVLLYDEWTRLGQ